LGNRPQFIKAALLSRKFDEHIDFQEVIIHTGQHFDINMSALFFDELQIKQPAYNLGIHSLKHSEMVEKITAELIEILSDENPDLVLVYGDTNSTMAGALAAKMFRVPIAHVEAGVRSFDLTMPEEKNRQWVDRISRLLFAPSQSAVTNLSNKAYAGDVFFVGDIMKDMAMHFAGESKKPRCFDFSQYVLATIHRASNTDDSEILKQIVDALNIINKETPVVVPLHPRTRKAIAKNDLDCYFQIIEPVGYLEMLYLLQNATFVITDSGGLQKEAYYHKKPAIVVRETSEWKELVDAGSSLLCQPVSTANILKNFEKMKVAKPNFTYSFYGDGNTAAIIFSEIQEFFLNSKDLLK